MSDLEMEVTFGTHTIILFFTIDISTDICPGFTACPGFTETRDINAVKSSDSKSLLFHHHHVTIFSERICIVFINNSIL